MKTFHIFDGGSAGYLPLHILKATSFTASEGFYRFYDDKADLIHAIAITPKLLVKLQD